MDRKVKVNFRNQIIKEFDAGTTLLEVSKSFQNEFYFPILLAKIDNKITNLSEKIIEDIEIDFFDRSSTWGNDAYNKSASFLLIAAIKKLYGKDKEVRIEHSIDKGAYCEIVGMNLTSGLVSEIENKMLELKDLGLKFDRMTVSKKDAVKYFQKTNQTDKVEMFKYISNSSVTLQRFDGIYDYFFGELVPTSKYLDEFKLSYLDKLGLVLTCPTIINPEITSEYVHQELIHNEFKKYASWCEVLESLNAPGLNKLISSGSYNNLIRMSEAYYNEQLMKITDKINADKHNIKIILIAGPTSSGKTTSSKKLEVFLQGKGMKTHQISLDDYFVNKADTPLTEDGQYDFESLKAIDVALFNRHLYQLLEGKEVLLPEYNFITGEREYKHKYLRLGENDVIIIEGLHALNEKLTMSIESKNKFKIYISALTQINIDNHNRVHTSDTRKLRRIVRDNKFRNYSATDTLKQWKDIRIGEEKNIFPYQENANVLINSALVYELGVIKTYVEPLLFSVDESDEMYPEALRLINLLRNFLTIPADEVPRDSIIREFIGGSCFHE